MPRWKGPLDKIDEYRWLIPESYKAGMRVPGLIYADQEMLGHILEEQALEQVRGAFRIDDERPKVPDLVVEEIGD